MENLKNKVVVITGGSSGIGLAVAGIFAQAGSRLFLIARDLEKLQQAKSLLNQKYGQHVHIEIISADVGNCAEISDAISNIGTTHKTIDILINNAGILHCGRFDEQHLNGIEQSIQVNYLGAVYATRAAWSYLAAAKGRVSFVSSVAGYMGLIGYTSYAPSKFAIAGFAECLRMEGKKENVKVSVIYPADTRTPMLEYEHQHALPETREINKNIKVKEPEVIARKLVNGILSDKFEIYCDAESRLYRMFKVILPGLFFSIIDEMANRGRQKHKSMTK